MDQLDEQPHVAEIILTEQTIAWCKSVLPKEENKEEDSAKKSTDFNHPEGSKGLLKKDDREEDFYFAPTKKKSQRRKKKEHSGKKNIKHDAVTFKLLHQLKLDVPITTDDIPAIITKLEQLAGYNQKVKDWEVNREEMKRKILVGARRPQEHMSEAAGN